MLQVGFDAPCQLQYTNPQKKNDQVERSAACLSAQRTMLLSGRAGRPIVRMAAAAPKVKYLQATEENIVYSANPSLEKT